VGPRIGLGLLKKRNISLLLYMDAHVLKISEDLNLQQHWRENQKPHNCAVGKNLRV
jgi:hypothetical protein